MGVTDGTVIGKVKILDNGSPAERWNLVLVSEGYQATQMAQFATDAQQFVDNLITTSPFSESYLLGLRLYDAINVYRVDVSSTDSGADDPLACGGTGATVATYFDASFCNGGIRRLLSVNNSTVFNVVNAQVPEWHMIMVMVNSAVYGGGGGDIAVFSTVSSAVEIGLHEMGHTAFGLADEYEYWAGCGAETDHNNHPAVEPAEPNVTIDSNRTTIKWRDLIAPLTPMPTTSNTNCAMCDPQPSPVLAGTVGAFEGAHYYHCGAFRPEFNCRMRALGFPFCAVCQRRIRQTLSPFLPRLRIFELLEELIFEQIHPGDWVSDPSPLDLVRLLGAIRRSQVLPGRLASDELSEVLNQIETMGVGQLQTLLLRVKASGARLETAAKMIEAQIDQRRR